MAVNIFERYGIKEVANVYFEALATEEAAGINAGDIVLYLDTLKVSTIEQTAENTSARGGKGNPELIMWDYGKEITLSIEDALYTPASMAAIWAGENGDLKNGVKDALTKHLFQKTKRKPMILPVIMNI